MRGSATIAIVVAVSAAEGAGCPTAAQLLYFGYSVGVEPDGSGDPCTPRNGCHVATSADATGAYVLTVYFAPQQEYGCIEAARFTPNWPEEWTVIDAWVCGGQVKQGTLFAPNNQIVVALSQCTCDGFASVSFRIDCSVPGEFNLNAGRPALRRCASGEWDEGGFYVSDRIVVGDFCGRLPLAPCDYCDDGSLAALFLDEPWDLVLSQGDSETDTIRVNGGACYSGLPECGGIDYYDPCFLGLDTPAPWVHIEPDAIPPSDNEQTFAVTVSAEGLETGEHETRLWTKEIGCETCQPNCQELRLWVTPPAPVERASWSRVKSHYRAVGQ